MQPKTHEPRQVHWVHGRPNRPSWYSRSSALKLLRVWVNLDSVMDDSYGAINNRNPWAKTRNGGEWKVRNTAQGVETDNRFFPFARPSTNIFAALKTWQGGAQLTQNIMHLLHPVCQIFWFLKKKKGTGIKPICDLFSARIYFIQLSFGNPSSFFSSLNALTIVLNPTQTRTNPTNAVTTVTSQKGTLVILLGTKFDSLGI